MWKAIGRDSNQTYMTADDKPELMQKLQKKYPSILGTTKGSIPKQIYPEALWMMEVRHDD